MDRALKLVGGYFQYFLENEALALMIYAHQNIDPMRCHFFGAGGARGASNDVLHSQRAAVAIVVQPKPITNKRPACTILPPATAAPLDFYLPALLDHLVQ